MSPLDVERERAVELPACALGSGPQGITRMLHESRTPLHHTRRKPLPDAGWRSRRQQQLLGRVHRHIMFVVCEGVQVVAGW